MYALCSSNIPRRFGSYITLKGEMTVMIRILHKRSLQNGLVATAAVTAILLLLRYPAAVQNGINRGLAVCGGVIIPTLYPFMLLAGILTESPLCRRPGRVTQAIARRVFGLPGCCAPAILLSLVGGYPAGMVAVSRLYRLGQITHPEMKRMTAFCLCGGPGFIVGTVGNGLMGSTQAGWLLYIAHIVAAVGIGILLGRGQRRTQEAPALPLEPPRRFATTVADTCRGLLTMCGFVTAAAMVLSLTEGMGIPRWVSVLTGLPADGIAAAMAVLLEVSCGCIALAGTPLAPLWLSLCLGWGGLSVQGQIAATLPQERVLCPRFWLWRICHGMIAGGLALLLFHLFPPDRSTGASPLAPLPFSVSAEASVMLLVLSFLTMLCFSEKKTGKTA